MLNQLPIFKLRDTHRSSNPKFHVSKLKEINKEDDRIGSIKENHLFRSQKFEKKKERKKIIDM